MIPEASLNKASIFSIFFSLLGSCSPSETDSVAVASVGVLIAAITNASDKPIPVIYESANPVTTVLMTTKITTIPKIVLSLCPTRLRFIACPSKNSNGAMIVIIKTSGSNSGSISLKKGMLAIIAPTAILT